MTEREMEPLVIYGSEHAHIIKQQHRLVDVVRFWSQYYGVPMIIGSEDNFMVLRPVQEEVGK